MDVHGKTNEAYFRRSVWGWHGLASYVEDMHADLAGKVKYWHSNDGDGLNEEDSRELARRLRVDTEDGSALRYVQSRDARLQSLPREVCTLCQGSGVRTHADNLRVFSGDVAAAARVEAFLPDGSQCNACNGVGTNAAWETHYGLEVSDLVEFADFLQECDGFEIW